MFVLDRLLIGGLRFVLEQVRVAAEEELETDPETLHRRLTEARLQLETGEIDAAEFERLEERIFATMREIRGGGWAAGPISFGEDGVGVEIDYDAGPEDPENTPAGRDEGASPDPDDR